MAGCLARLWVISIHAPREGSDLLFSTLHSLRVRFLSTLPARGATDVVRAGGPDDEFLSTLPARGATSSVLPGGVNLGYFYPRSPRGERRQDL